MKIFTLFILLLLLPVSAWAEATKESVSYIECSWNGSEVTSSTKTATATVVTEGVTEWGKNDGQEHWYVVNDEINITDRVTVTGHVHLILADGCKLTASNGIEVSERNSLTIYAQSTDENTMGKLTAKGADYNAGIGGGYNGSGGTFSTGTDGHAFIIASSIQDNSEEKKESWSGVIFEGDAGAVYGSPTLQTDATIPAGKTLTIENGKTLTIGEGVTLTVKEGATLTNNGKIINYGTINGTVTGKVAIPLTENMITVEDATYTGVAVTPDVTVEKYTENTDYTVSYSDNINAGTAKVTVTPIDGSLLLGDAVTKEFTIEKATPTITLTVPTGDDRQEMILFMTGRIKRRQLQ